MCRVAPTSSHCITGVKQPRAGLVLGWATSETSREVKTEPECIGFRTEWLQRPGMVTILWKISSSLLGLSSQIENTDRLKINIFLSYLIDTEAGSSASGQMPEGSVIHNWWNMIQKYSMSLMK